MADQTYVVSGRFSSANLTGDSPPPSSKGKRKRSTTLPEKEMQNPQIAHRPRFSTPDPRSPGLPSSHPTPGLTDGSSLPSAHTTTGVLSLPNEKDEEDGIIRSVVITDPFGSAKAIGGFYSNSLLLDPEIIKDADLEVPESTKITLSRTVLSQVAETEFDIPAAKRKKLSRELPQPLKPVELDDYDEADTEVIYESVEEDDTQASKDWTPNYNIIGGTESGVEDSDVDDDMNDDQDDEDHFEEDEDPDYDTNSNWDGLEDVQARLNDYNKLGRTVKGHENWTPQQAKLHKLLALRGCWPMFQHSWAVTFSIRNIYPQVFAPANSRKRVAITAKANEFRATRAIEKIFDLSPLVGSYRQSGNMAKVGNIIKKELRRYVAWATYDAGVQDRVHIPTVEVYEFNTRKWAAKIRKAAKEAKGPVAIKEEPTSEWNPDDDEEAAITSDPISDEVERRLRQLAARHRRDLVLPDTAHLPEYTWEYREPPPLLFAFVVLQHMVMVVSVDAGRPDNEIIVFSELDMSLADQWLWNALAIALPVHMARDALWERRERFPLVQRMEVEDPDA